MNQLEGGTRPWASSLGRSALAFVVVVFGLALVYVAQPVLILLVWSAFLAVLFLPALKFCNRRLPAGVSLALVLVGALGVALAMLALLTSSLWSIGVSMPHYVVRFEAEIEAVLSWARSQGLDLRFDTIGTEKVLGKVLGALSVGLGSLFGVIGDTVVVLLLTVFMLVEAVRFEAKMKVAFCASTQAALRSSLVAVMAQVHRYVLMKTLVSLVTGLSTTLLCLVLGVDFAVFWGFLAFLLNFIPSIGSIIAVLPPVLIALLQYGLGWRALLLAALLTVLQMFFGNVVEPRVMGRSVNLSALVVFVSMIFWGWMWGMVGIILSVPLTVTFKLICEHFDDLRPVAILLGDEVGEAQGEADGRAQRDANAGGGPVVSS